MINLSALTDGMEQEETQDNALTVSQTYDLLNENVNVSWNGSTIKLKSPYSLNTISSISFRSFSGELLPYTTLELPKINFGLKVLFTKSLSYPVYLSGNDNPFMKSFINLLNQYSNSTDNIIYEDSKIFTYDSSQDSQITYNVEEILEILNSAFNSLLGGISYAYSLGGEYNFNPISYNNFFSYYPFKQSTGKLFFMNNSIVRTPYIDTSRKIQYNTFDFSDSKYPYKAPYFASSSLSTTYRLIQLSANASGVLSRYYVFRSNELIDSSADIIRERECDLWTNNIYSLEHFYFKSPTREGLIIMPYNNNKTINIYFDNVQQTITENVPDYDHYLILGVCYVTSSQIIICYLGYNFFNSASLEFASFNFGATSSYSRLRTPHEVSTENYNYYKNCGISYLSMGLTWNNKISNYTTHGLTLYNFYRTIYDDINHFVKILYNEFLYDNDETVSEIYHLTNYNLMDYSHERVIRKCNPANMNTENEIYNAFIFGIWNYEHLQEGHKIDSSTNPIAKINSTDSYISGWHMNGKIINYITNEYLDDFTCYYKELNENTIYPQNRINDKLTIETNKWFSLDKTTGEFSYPEVYFAQRYKISFIPFIKTSPLYFNLQFIPNTKEQSEDYSINLKSGELRYFEINSHIADTLESLILLKYETNDLKFRCLNFPNNDNIVFSMNETANVQFKSFNINASGIELICSIIDNENENIELETLQKLYGKLIVSIDFKS